tara:strand:+ start:4409 stop:5425 length:1017 start_codon:yes stop_codon:yes gene_type:complete
MNNLLKEAIADAKAVRETALANAKLALEEAFTPRLQSMLSAKLSEDEELGYEEEPVAEEEAPLEEPVEAPVEEPAPAPEEPVAEYDDAYSDEIAEDEEMMDAPVEEPAPVEEEEEDLELEAILRELEGEDEEAPVSEGEGDEEEVPVEEQSDSSDIGKGDNKVDNATSSDEDDPGKGKLSENDEEEVDLEEIINALREEEGDEEAVEENDTAGVDDGDAAKELDEAYKVIRFMKSKLNEVNLLNAKLLFSNKLFRNHSLSENQKMKVIENFDRAQTLREVKLVFATLAESFKLGGKKRVKTIKESYASRTTRSTRPSKRILREGNDVANRFKKLAGLL